MAKSQSALYVTANVSGMDCVFTALIIYKAALVIVSGSHSRLQIVIIIRHRYNSNPSILQFAS